MFIRKAGLEHHEKLLSCRESVASPAHFRSGTCEPPPCSREGHTSSPSVSCGSFLLSHLSFQKAFQYFFRALRDPPTKSKNLLTLGSQCCLPGDAWGGLGIFLGCPSWRGWEASDIPQEPALCCLTSYSARDAPSLRNPEVLAPVPHMLAFAFAE